MSKRIQDDRSSNTTNRARNIFVPFEVRRRESQFPAFSLQGKTIHRIPNNVKR